MTIFVVVEAVLVSLLFWGRGRGLPMLVLNVVVGGAKAYVDVDSRKVCAALRGGRGIPRSHVGQYVGVRIVPTMVLHNIWAS